MTDMDLGFLEGLVMVLLGYALGVRKSRENGAAPK